ncbi:uncharacterized protein LOC128303684 [Anopheles moucheti]|uniref:uncharacterized protein LOC128303684 n=1 Tax=Anopheles moucheti TaxID=186751 RepID=UPI0022F0399E|nr:uncharacterized protein LOC128303684 [Anopheles moucheti]
MFQLKYVCRVCLAEGTWDIFSKAVVQDEMCTVASINRIQEKLQYVTQLEVHETDGLPLHICELCIVQLNVAYRFKLLAVESDSKLRQSYEISEPSPEVPNTLTNGENDDVANDETAPETMMMKDEISIEPTQITEQNVDSWTAVEDENASIILPQALHNNGMVCVQKDIINPAEDEAYLQDIVKKEVISLQWTKTNEEMFDTQHSTTLTTIPSVQSKGQRKQPKSPRKRKRISNVKQHGSGKGSRKDHTRRQPKVSKKKENKLTTPNNDTPKRNSTGSTKKTTTMKPADAEQALRKRRLQKVLNSLRIDMMYNNTVEWHKINNIPNAEILGDPLLPKMPMKRRNSVCVSSFTPWL